MSSQPPSDQKAQESEPHGSPPAIARWLAQPLIDEPIIHSVIFKINRRLAEQRRQRLSQIISISNPFLDDPDRIATVQPPVDTEETESLCNDLSKVSLDDEFKCIFHFAGCSLVFTSIYAWKEHILSSHLQLHRQICLGPHYKPRASHSHEPENSSSAGQSSRHDWRSSLLIGVGSFYTRPVRALPTLLEHMLLEAVVDACETCSMPRILRCPVSDCASQFGGPNAWPERLDHIAVHLMNSPVTFGCSGDEEVIYWASQPFINIISPKPREWGWVLTPLQKRIVALSDSGYSSLGHTLHPEADDVKPSSSVASSTVSVISEQAAGRILGKENIIAVPSDLHFSHSLSQIGASTTLSETCRSASGGFDAQLDISLSESLFGTSIESDDNSSASQSTVMIASRDISHVLSEVLDGIIETQPARINRLINQRTDYTQVAQWKGDVQHEGPKSRRETHASHGQGNGKRWNRSNGEDDNGEDNDDTPNREDSTGTMNTRISSRIRLFACPFHQHDPRWERCEGRGWESVPRVKEHIRRRHVLHQFSCRRCLKKSKDQNALDLHAQKIPQCTWRHDKIEPAQYKEIRSRTRFTGLSEERKWMEVYRICFPGSTNIPDPYVDNRRISLQNQQPETHAIQGDNEDPNVTYLRVWSSLCDIIEEKNPEKSDDFIKDVVAVFRDEEPLIYRKICQELGIGEAQISDNNITEERGYAAPGSSVYEEMSQDNTVSPGGIVPYTQMVFSDWPEEMGEFFNS